MLTTHRRAVATAAAVAALAATTIQPTPAHAVEWTTIAMWDMDEPATGCTGTVMEDKADATGAERGPNDGTIFTVGVSRNGDAPCPFGADDSGRYKFLNWSNRIDVGGVGDPSTDFMVDNVNVDASKLSRVSVQDPNKLLNPGTSSFRMTTRFKPLNVWRSLDGGATYDWYLPDFADPQPASLNMFQRGPASGVGGQYKMEMIAYGANRGKVRCIFRDTEYRLQNNDTDRAKHEVKITASVATNFRDSTPAQTYTSKVECGLDRVAGEAFLKVFDNHTGSGINQSAEPVTIPVEFGSVDPYHTVASERDFTVGTNYGSNESDAYSGNFYYIKLEIGS